jgi:hypothetical protein
VKALLSWQSHGALLSDVTVKAAKPHLSAEAAVQLGNMFKHAATTANISATKRGKIEG